MIDRRQFEECYCPEGKDPNFPQNWIRKKYVLDYPADMEPPYPSDGDLNMIIHKSLLVDNLDNYSIGVYLRLILSKILIILETFVCPTKSSNELGLYFRYKAKYAI